MQFKRRFKPVSVTGESSKAKVESFALCLRTVLPRANFRVPLYCVRCRSSPRFTGRLVCWLCMIRRWSSSLRRCLRSPAGARSKKTNRVHRRRSPRGLASELRDALWVRESEEKARMRLGDDCVPRTAGRATRAGRAVDRYRQHNSVGDQSASPLGQAMSAKALLELMICGTIPQTGQKSQKRRGRALLLGRLATTAQTASTLFNDSKL